MSPFFARTLTQTQAEARRARDVVMGSRGARRSKQIPGFNVQPDSSAVVTVPNVQLGQDKKTNYVPYVIAGAIAFFLITR